MKVEIKKRIEKITKRKIPTGYKYENGYFVPDSWKVNKLYDLFDRVNKKNDIGCDNVLTISAQQGLISQYEYYNHSYASENKEGYYLLRKGDFAYNRSYSEGYPYGAIKRLDNYNEGIVSPLYICLTSKGDICSDYYIQYFEGGIYNREIYGIAQEGARNHGLLNVAIGDFFSGHIVCPPRSEQKKIAEILSCCDKVIQLKKQLIDEKRRQKKWLMDNLLNPDGLIRLPGFVGVWKETTVEEICKVIGGGTPDTKIAGYWSGNIPWISSSDLVEEQINILNATRYITEEAVSNSATRICPKNTILIVSRVGVGKVAIAPFQLCTSQDFTNLTCVTENVYFTAMLLLQAINQIMKYTQGTSIQGISSKEIKAIVLRFPTLEEQDAISKVLLSANSEIDFLEKELDWWKKKKKSLMQLLLTGLVRTNI